MTSQSHFTLSFPLTSPADAKALMEQLPPLMPGLFQAQDAIGTIHSSRFTILDETTLLFLGDFDGGIGQLMAELAKAGGPVFDAIFQHVENPPPTPVAANADTFVEWTVKHCLQAATTFSAYSGVTAKEIRALATAADVTGAGKELPFPGDLTHQVIACLCGGETAAAREGAQNPERFSHGRYPALRPIRAVGEEPGWVLHRL